MVQRSKVRTAPHAILLTVRGLKMCHAPLGPTQWLSVNVTVGMRLGRLGPLERHVEGIQVLLGFAPA